jgi:hypothetical protein
VQHGQLSIPNKQQWAEAAALYATVATTSSDRFRAEHEVSLKGVADKFEGLQSSISMSILRQAEKMLKDFHKQLAEAVCKHSLTSIYIIYIYIYNIYIYIYIYIIYII